MPEPISGPEPLALDDVEPCGENMCHCHCGDCHVCGCDCWHCDWCGQGEEHCQCVEAP